MDPEINELKALVKQNLAMTEDMGRTLRKMRRAQKWGSFFQTIWWMLIIAVSGATYYLYFQPYVGKLEQLYEQVGGSNQSPGWNASIQNFFKNIAPPKPTN